MSSPPIFSFVDEADQVLIEEKLRALMVILNRPQKLNSLSYEMVSKITRTLKVYAEDPTIKVVILKGKGKAFCAGGDVLRVVLSSVAGHWSFAANFYKKQLELDHLLATYNKPVVSLINGTVMGGGAGLSMHGHFRIVTENAVFSMPETLIGHFPDVGASYFLSRLPGHFGEYLGLTGARISGYEMLACGLATHFVLSKDLIMLEDALCQVASSDVSSFSKLLDKFVHEAYLKLKPSSACLRLDIINECFSGKTVEEILSTLENRIKIGAERWLIEALVSIKAASPISLKISLRAIREGRILELERCLVRDYNIGYHVIRRTVSNDFYEGSRAMIIEKDRLPKWEPSKLELVSEELVDRYFAEVKADEAADSEGMEIPIDYFLTQARKSKL